jgi:predicted transcriptional regulator
MEKHLAPDLEERLATLAASAGRNAAEVLNEAIALWEERNAQQRRPPPDTTHSPAQAAARIRRLREGTFLPEGETIEDLINYGRA